MVIFFISFALCALLTSCKDNGTNSSRSDCAEDAAAKTAFEYFVELSKIPRCTYNEKEASGYLAAFGKERGFEVFQDTMHNILIRKRGSKGRENEPYIILQAHIDIVCVKDPEAVHDFESDPIIPIVDGDWIKSSKRTTLGADNGSGVSIIMAILASNCVSHPPIEALFTTQEEAGLKGALAFDVSQLKGLRLINLDNVTEEVFFAGSKWDGGDDIIIPMLPAALAKIANLPEWPYKENSPLREKMVKVFKDFYGRAPTIANINHSRAGVECMAFAERMPDACMVSIGPTIENIHTPDERMGKLSFERVYEYLVRVLREL